MDTWAPRIDKVLHEQLDRLQHFVEAKPAN
jgi:hypothetical protein